MSQDTRLFLHGNPVFGHHVWMFSCYFCLAQPVQHAPSISICFSWGEADMCWTGFSGQIICREHFLPRCLHSIGIIVTRGPSPTVPARRSAHATTAPRKNHQNAANLPPLQRTITDAISVPTKRHNQRIRSYSPQMQMGVLTRLENRLLLTEIMDRHRITPTRPAHGASAHSTNPPTAEADRQKSVRQPTATSSASQLQRYVRCA